MNIGMAKVFQMGVKLRKRLMAVLVHCHCFHKLKGLEMFICYVVQIGVARATLCHTLAMPLIMGIMGVYKVAQLHATIITES